MVKDKASGRQTRDTLIDLLLERCRDRTSFTRAAVLKTWTRMVDAQAIPVKMILRVTKMTSRHLLDNSSLVRKAGIQLFSAVVRKNPFAPILHPDYFDEQLETLLDKLREKGVEIPDTLFDDEMEEEENELESGWNIISERSLRLVAEKNSANLISCREFVISVDLKKNEYNIYLVFFVSKNIKRFITGTEN